MREHKTSQRIRRNACNISLYSITLLCNVMYIILHIVNMQFRNFRAARLTSAIYSKDRSGQLGGIQNNNSLQILPFHISPAAVLQIRYNINIFGVPVSTTKHFSSLNFQDNKMIKEFGHRGPKRSLQGKNSLRPRPLCAWKL
jgi:hypothetical protein